MDIFVGNLSFKAKEADVYKLFLPFGGVAYISIAMDKKGRESRGFGFLKMPDREQALSAIAALNHKEFMGRPINVEPARINPEAAKPPAPARATGYKQGRRTRSFMRKRAEAGITERVMPHKQNKKNPMAWPKKHSRPKPWQKSRGEQKEVEAKAGPWEKFKAESKPWKKTEGEARPWIKKGKGRGKSGSYKEKKGRF